MSGTTKKTSIKKSWQRVLEIALATIAFSMLLGNAQGHAFPSAMKDLRMCYGVMGNRDIYGELSRVCSDCANLLMDKTMEAKCRQNCFFNEDFAVCVIALEMEDDMHNYSLKISALKEGK